MAGSLACSACLDAPLLDDADEPGFYEAMTDEAKARKMPGRLDAEQLLWSRHEQMAAIADAVEAEAAAIKAERGIIGSAGRSTSWRALITIAIKARSEAGKDARAAADMILMRERHAYAERADRLYADEQRRAGKVRH